MANMSNAARFQAPRGGVADVSRTDRGENVLAISLDPRAGGTANGKPIWDVPTISENLNRTGYDWYTNNYGELDDGVLNFGFWADYDELANSYYVNQDGSIAFNEAYYFADFSAFNPAQIAAATASLALWDDLINIKFQRTTAPEGDINFGNTYTGGAQAYAYLPFGDTDDEYFFENYGFVQAGRLGGDVWIDGFVPSNFNPIKDSYYAVTTLIHETGHALGLSHPGDYDALDDDDGDGVPDPITYANDATFAQDSLQYSIMSYFDAYETGAQHIDWSLLNFAYAATPLVHDIAAIQAIYGADPNTRTGNTVYGFNSTADRSAYDFSLNTRPIVAIYDAGGNDTLDLSGWNTPSVIDLNGGAFSSGGGIEQFLTLAQINANRAALGFAPRSQATFDLYNSLFKDPQGLTNGLFKDNISIAYGTIIENAVGGGGNDLIIANKAVNVLNGGGGVDTVSYSAAASGVIATLLINRGLGGDALGDKYVSIEKLEGSKFNDILTGSNGNDAGVSGLAGNDIIYGGGGNDLLDGGDGNDLLLGDGQNDTLNGGAGTDILEGGDHNDVLNGGADNDRLNGGDGNDRLNGGVGSDRLTGGDGRDIFLFSDLGGTDTVADFKRGQDKVDLTGLDAKSATAAHDAFKWIGSAAFSGLAGELHTYKQGSDYFLSGDVNGDKIADFTINTGTVQLAQADIVFV